MQYLGKNSISSETFITGILKGDIITLSRALSLLESTLEQDNALSLEILEGILPNTGEAIRVGITGAPGVGKSTFIEVLGLYLVEKGHKVAVLTVDPSSPRSSGSILGDKTRMEKLSKSPNAYIRPSAAGKSLGGVAQHTRESILLCEAAGFDIIMVETVGVGQSEIMVRDMVDFFLLLMIAGAGDELQGIKKGIIEIADTLVITKADGDNKKRASQAQTMFRNALHLLSPSNSSWEPKVLTCSSEQNEGIVPIWDTVIEYHRQMSEADIIEALRRQQRINWLQDCIRDGIARQFSEQANDDQLEDLMKQVENGQLLPRKAARAIIKNLTG